MLPEPIIIIPAQPSDLETVLDILEEATRWVSSRGIEQWQSGQFQHTAGRGDVYPALLDTQAIGTVSIHWNERIDKIIWGDIPDLEEAGYVHRLAVCRDFAGKGLGRYLLQWAERRIAEVGKKFIRLDCMAENPALRAYYEQAGFIYRGETQGKGWKAALYEKKVQTV